MAIFQTTFYSNTLHRLTDLTLILPVEPAPGATTDLKSSTKGLRPLVLLHGFSGNHTDWLFNSRIQVLARKFRLAVICPSGENAFHVDDIKRDALYEKYLCEVLAFAKDVFNIEATAKETTIGGFSMGGYGAFCNGLKHPELFGNIIALSSAFITGDLSKKESYEDNHVASAAYYEHIFGKPQELDSSNLNPLVLVEKLLSSCGKAPRIFMACGTEDFIVENNNIMSNELTALGVSHKYIAEQGIHDWPFWDKMIETGLAWVYEENENS